MEVETIFRVMLSAMMAFSVLILPEMVLAQSEDEPLRLVYVDLTDGEGGESKSMIEELLDGSDQIDLEEEAQFLEAGAEADLGTDVLRKEQRSDEEDAIAAWMWKTDVEGILLHDFRDGGSTMAVGVIGPHGWELTDVERPLRGGEVDEDEAMTVLEEIFVALVPEVRGFRRDVAEGDLDDDDFEMPESAEDDEASGGDLRDQAVSEHEKSHGNLERSLRLRAGTLAGRRTMNMEESDGGFELRHSTSLMGPVLEADFLMWTFKQNTRAVEFGVDVGMAPFTTTFEDDELEGQFFRAGLDARYIFAISDILRLRAISGLDTINLSLDANENYTGHGYLTGRIGGGIGYDIGSLMTIELDALFMPIFDGSNSGGAYGDVSGWLGYGAEGAININAADPFLVGLHYQIQTLNLDYVDVERLGGSMAHSRDIFHQATVTVGYRL